MDSKSRVSKTVQREINIFYAKLASAAAKKAVAKVDENNPNDAIMWAGKVENWLIKAGAHAAGWSFRQPNI